MMCKRLWACYGPGLMLFALGCSPADDASLSDSSRSQLSPEVTLGGFNLLRLGHGLKDFNRVADLIDRADFDIFGATEVMKLEAAEELLQILRARSGAPWQISTSTYANGESNYKEHFAFFWRSDRVQVSSSPQSFCSSPESEGRSDHTCYVSDPRLGGEPSFERDPFVGHFKVGDMGLTLITVHLVYGGTSAEDVERRKSEMRALRASMDRVREMTPDHKIVTVGDFNLSIVSDDDAPEPEESRWVREAMPEEVFTTWPQVDGLIDHGTTIGNSSYDHILYYEDSIWSVVDESVKVVRDFEHRSAEERAKYKAEVSDHYPVAATFKLAN